jgi:D-alanine-D-alanine ligase
VIIGNKKIIIKHIWEHSSEDIDDFSVFSANDKGKLDNAIKKRRNLNSYFAEEYIEGREFNISMIEESNGGHVLPPAEMTFVNYPKGKVKIVGYKAKWDEDSFESKNTIRRFDFPKKDKKLLDSLTKISEKVWDIFGLKGYARIDFRVDKSGKPYVLEINTNPCIVAGMGFATACERDGINYTKVISKLVKEALQKIK